MNLDTNTHKQLQVLLSFSDQSSVVEPNVVRVRPTNKVVIFPGQTKYVNVQRSARPCPHNNEVEPQPVVFIAHMCPASRMTKLC